MSNLSSGWGKKEISAPLLRIQIISLKSGDSNCFSQICICVFLSYDTPYPLGTKLDIQILAKVYSISPLFLLGEICQQDNNSHSSRKSLQDLKPALALGIDFWKVI